MRHTVWITLANLILNKHKKNGINGYFTNHSRKIIFNMISGNRVSAIRLIQNPLIFPWFQKKFPWSRKTIKLTDTI